MQFAADDSCRSVKNFLRALREGGMDETTKLAFEFLIPTAARTAEVLGARLDDIDLGAAIWTVPDCADEYETRAPRAASAACSRDHQRAKELSVGSDLLFPGRTIQKRLS